MNLTFHVSPSRSKSPVSIVRLPVDESKVRTGLLLRGAQLPVVASYSSNPNTAGQVNFGATLEIHTGVSFTL